MQMQNAQMPLIYASSWARPPPPLCMATNLRCQASHLCFYLGLVSLVLCSLPGLLHTLVLLHQVVQAVDCSNGVSICQLPLPQAQICACDCWCVWV